MTNEYIENMNTETDAVSFYADVLCNTGLLIERENGFLKPDGTSAFPGFLPDDDAQMLDDAHRHATTLLATHGVDVEEVLLFCEAVIVRRVLLMDADYHPKHIAVRHVADLADEDERKCEMRRRMCAWENLLETMSVAVPDFVHDEVSNGLAIPQNSHPILRAYVARIVEYLGEDVHAGLGEASGSDDQSIIQEMRRQASEVRGEAMPDESGDIDGDDNDDDPFGWDA